MISTKSLLLAGIGALGYYIYTRMSEEQKNKIVEGLKQQLNKVVDNLMPTNSRAAFETRVDNANSASSIGDREYTG